MCACLWPHAAVDPAAADAAVAAPSPPTAVPLPAPKRTSCRSRARLRSRECYGRTSRRACMPTTSVNAGEVAKSCFKLGFRPVRRCSIFRRIYSSQYEMMRASSSRTFCHCTASFSGQSALHNTKGCSPLLPGPFVIALLHHGASALPNTK